MARMLLAMALLALASAVQGLTAKDFDGKNIVFFMTDQERAIQHFPKGWDVENLPGLTRLKKNGVTFKKAFTNACMCSPARSTLMSGFLPAQHGVYYTLEEGMPNTTFPQVELPQPDQLHNMATVAAAAGYNVVYKGKFHAVKAANPNGTWAPSDVNQYGWSRWNPKDAGANQSLWEGGGGTYPGGNNDYRFMTDNGTMADGNEGVLAYINSVAAQSQPFFLVVSLVNPHDVLFYPRNFNASGYDQSYLDGDIGLPETVDEDLSTKPTVQAQFVKIFAVSGQPVGPQEQKEYLNFYGNLIKASDNYLVQTLDALDAAGLTNNTLVIRTADHGEMGLAHGGMRQKNFNMYEESLNIPLVYSNPVLYPKPLSTDALVSHVDMLPTLASLLRAPRSARANWEGKDYSDIVMNPTTAKPVQDYVVFQYGDYQSGQDQGPYPQQPNHVLAIREVRWKLAKYFDPSSDSTKVRSQWEMYDLKTDPNEKKNLAFANYTRTPAQEKEYQRLRKKLAQVEAVRLAPLPLTRDINLTAATQTVQRPTPLILLDQGTSAGIPVGTGGFSCKLVIEPSSANPAVGMAYTTFVITSDVGLIRGNATSTFSITGTNITLTGKAAFTSGTAAFRGIKAKNLVFYETDTLDGQNGRIAITGKARY